MSVLQARHFGPVRGGQWGWPVGARGGICSTVSCPVSTFPAHIVTRADGVDTLIKLLLTLASTAMGMFTATAGYLYMAHSLSNPAYAPVAGVLCGGVPFLAVRAGASVLGDA